MTQKPATTPPAKTAPVVFVPVGPRRNTITGQYQFSSEWRSSFALTRDGSLTPATAPAAASGPSQLVPSSTRASITLVNPVDGDSVYAAPDAASIPNAAHIIPPGSQMTMTGVIMSVWLQGLGNATPIYYSTT